MIWFFFWIFMVQDFWLEFFLQKIEANSQQQSWYDTISNILYTYAWDNRTNSGWSRKGKRERERPCNKSYSCTHSNVVEAWPNVKQGDNRYLQKRTPKTDMRDFIQPRTVLKECIIEIAYRNRKHIKQKHTTELRMKNVHSNVS